MNLSHASNNLSAFFHSPLAWIVMGEALMMFFFIHTKKGWAVFWSFVVLIITCVIAYAGTG